MRGGDGGGSVGRRAEAAVVVLLRGFRRHGQTFGTRLDSSLGRGKARSTETGGGRDEGGGGASSAGTGSTRFSSASAGTRRRPLADWPSPQGPDETGTILVGQEERQRARQGQRGPGRWMAGAWHNTGCSAGEQATRQASAAKQSLWGRFGGGGGGGRRQAAELVGNWVATHKKPGEQKPVCSMSAWRDGCGEARGGRFRD